MTYPLTVAFIMLVGALLVVLAGQLKPRYGRTRAALEDIGVLLVLFSVALALGKPAIAALDFEIQRGAEAAAAYPAR